jgi:hypothetical protein
VSAEVPNNLVSIDTKQGSFMRLCGRVRREALAEDQPDSVLVGKGTIGLAMLEEDVRAGRLDDPEIVWWSVNDAALICAWHEIVPWSWWDFLVATDRVEYPLPPQARLVTRASCITGTPEIYLEGRDLEREWIYEREVMMRQAADEGLWHRAPEIWRERSELIQGMGTGVTALHAMWVAGAGRVWAYGMDGTPWDAWPGGAEWPYWAILLEMRDLVGRLGDLEVSWFPDTLAARAEAIRAGALGG